MDSLSLEIIGQGCVTVITDGHGYGSFIAFRVDIKLSLCEYFPMRAFFTVQCTFRVSSGQITRRFIASH